MAEDTADVLEAIGATDATVVGLSMGGMIAQELAIRHPDLVRRLILLGSRPPSPYNIQPSFEVFSRILGGPPPGVPLAEHIRGMWSDQCGPGFADRHPELVDELVDQTLERVTPRAGVMHQLRGGAGWSRGSRLASIAAPTVVIHGASDPLSPVGNGLRLARLIPSARYIELHGVGHLSPIEAPDVVAEIVEEEALGTVHGGCQSLKTFGMPRPSNASPL